MTTPQPPARHQQAAGAHPASPPAAPPPAAPPSATSAEPFGAAGVPSAADPNGARSRDVGDASVGELISTVTRDLSTLMRQELALAQAEMKQEAAKTGKAAGMLGGAAFAGWFAVLFLSIALWAGLSNLMNPGWAGLIVTAIWAIIAAVLFATGRTKFRQVNPKPERTVDTLSQVPDALKGQRGGTP